MKLEVNGQVRQVDAPDEMPLLWLCAICASAPAPPLPRWAAAGANQLHG